MVQEAERCHVRDFRIAAHLTRPKVGAARQYSGTLGRTDICQVAVSLHLEGEKGSGCIGMRLYLPAE